MIPYLLQREQLIPLSIEEVFNFFAHAENLDRLTPAWLHFRILSPLPIEMRTGTHIQYQIRWGWIPLTWSTEITTWNPPYEFVDEQRRGPYKLWQHTHTFRTKLGGTLMTDTIRYSMPWGPLGKLMHRLVVRRDLESLFEYRRQQIQAMAADGSLNMAVLANT